MIDLSKALLLAEEATGTTGDASTTTSGATTIVQDVKGIDWQAVIDTCVNWLTTTGIKILISLVVMIIAFKIIDVITKKIDKRLAKKKVDVTLAKVGVSSVRIALKGLIIIGLVGYLGFETASLSAVVASIGVGISLAVQGTLSNFAGGVIIIIMRPFKIGDFITASGESGTVEDIKLFYTHIVTVDNKAIMIPNGTLANGVIVNVSAKETRRVDVTMSVSYNTNLEQAKNLMTAVCAKNDLILKDPAVFITVTEYAESSINIVCRAWVKSADYWTVNFYLLDEFKKAFDEAGIEIPFNQLDLNVKQLPATTK